ncbi:MAG: biotin--protein ligase [Candidatus Micrarchaeota archaeon]|nr:biotin--protein ligase [Candidatus Micrarchaeota archaeon]
MEGTARQKVPGGKLLIVKLRYGSRIEGAQILGDFFLHPEESLKDIEDSLVGISYDANEEEIARVVGAVMDRERIEAIGITPEAIANSVKQAMKNGMESNRA